MSSGADIETAAPHPADAIEALIAAAEVMKWNSVSVDRSTGARRFSIARFDASYWKIDPRLAVSLDGPNHT